MNKKSQNKSVWNPENSQKLRDARTPFVSGDPNAQGEGVNVNEIDEEGNYGTPYQQQAAYSPAEQQKDKKHSIKYSIELLNRLGRDLPNLASEEAGSNRAVIEELNNAIQNIGNVSLMKEMKKFKDIYDIKPVDFMGKLYRIVQNLYNELHDLYMANEVSPFGLNYHAKSQESRKIMSKKILNEKQANLKEIRRQHFNNFAVSDIQVINKLQFLDSMLNVENSPPEEPKEYTRPKIGENDEKFSELHGNGAIDGKLTKAELQDQVKDLRAILKDERGYSDEEIDECVAIINVNQRTHRDIDDESILDSREDKGYSDEEAKRMKGDRDRLESNYYQTKKASNFNKNAQEYFDVMDEEDYRTVSIAGYKFKTQDDEYVGVKRKDGEDLSGGDEEKIQGIMLGKGFYEPFVDLTNTDSNNFYKLYVSEGEINKSASKIERVAQTSGLVTGPTTGGTVWCPKTKEPIEEYLCWHTCVDGKKIGEKVVCGKRVFDAFVADNNERTLERLTVFQQNKENAIISGPNYRLEDGIRRKELRDEEIPTESRLQELHKTTPFVHDTTKWNHSPTLSDDKKHDWSQKTVIASNKIKLAQDSSYSRYLDTIEERVEKEECSVEELISDLGARLPDPISTPIKSMTQAIERIFNIIQQKFSDDTSALLRMEEYLEKFVYPFVDEDNVNQIKFYLRDQFPSLRPQYRSAISQIHKERIGLIKTALLLESDVENNLIFSNNEMVILDDKARDYGVKCFKDLNDSQKAEVLDELDKEIIKEASNVIRGFNKQSGHIKTAQSYWWSEQRYKDILNDTQKNSLRDRAQKIILGDKNWPRGTLINDEPTSEFLTKEFMERALNKLVPFRSDEYLESDDVIHLCVAMFLRNYPHLQAQYSSTFIPLQKVRENEAERESWWYMKDGSDNPVFSPAFSERTASKNFYSKTIRKFARLEKGSSIIVKREIRDRGDNIVYSGEYVVIEPENEVGGDIVIGVVSSDKENIYGPDDIRWIEYPHEYIESVI